MQSPLFHPEFVRAVAEVRDGVEVAVLRDASRIVGFFPYCRHRGDVGRPVAASLTDFQGLIASSDIDITAEQIVRSCGLRAWHFDHLLATQPVFAPYHHAQAESPYVDLKDGFEAFAAQRRKAGSSQVATAMRKLRKIERDVGPLHLEPISADVDVFDQVIEWKVDQYRRIKSVNHLAPDWTVALLRRVVSHQGQQFGGMMSALYAGDELIAAHLGMRNGSVMHWWFPTYNRQFMSYSPGIILLAKLAQAASSLGIERIDLGKGDERYKSGFKSGAFVLAVGSVDFRRLARTVRSGWVGLQGWVRRSPLRAPVQHVVRSCRGWSASIERRLARASVNE